MVQINKDSTNQSIDFDLRDTDGAVMTIAYNTSGLKMYYRRGATGSATSVTPADLATIGTAHTNGGIKEVSSSNMPGIHRTDWPDAAFAAGVDRVTLTISGVTNMEPTSIIVELTEPVTVSNNKIAASLDNTELDNVEARVDTAIAAADLEQNGAAATALSTYADGNGNLNANAKRMNNVEIQGAGTSGNKWRGA